ncbi:phosphoenolpyruvate synthase [Dyadobacter sp. CY326]|uniref:phosphoenolpyruvate synthase n=1 Tax=Dyadobacter sp. CY326 TaxID=2907300 RepID=UPI001EFFA43D|nr:phosphoenolpyruvate synthase [Dyadobacter sp. CY326]MCE7065006.1 phosphoenolpyruvate synthase [Dyadobacter sp. CY326]
MGKQMTDLVSYTVVFQDIKKDKIAAVGGKGTNLGALSLIEGIRVPEGFCITTNAYNEIIANNKTFDLLLDNLGGLRADNRQEIASISAKIRQIIENTAIPLAIENEVRSQLAKLGEDHAYAIRSSATAEDLPAASFAGQQESYLNVIGLQSIMPHISKCWASLFTDRAVSYRIQNGYGHRDVQLAVVVQKMVFPEAAGILFTADPVSGHRKISSIDASFGLGEALVSGIVNADHYKVRDGNIVEKKISTKKLAIQALKEGGTKEFDIAPELQNAQTLTDAQILALAQTGRKIESHFGQPQDIEWCLVKGAFHVVQSRPITTLFPIPNENNAQDTEIIPRVYVSVGHQQMMTDAMKPLGLSFWLLLNSISMRIAAGRLFVDVTSMLASTDGRDSLFNTLGKSDPLVRDALTTILSRENFIKLSETDAPVNVQNMASPASKTAVVTDFTVVADLIKLSETTLQVVKQQIEIKSGPALIDFIVADLPEFKKILFDPRMFRALTAAFDAAAWINEKMNEWLGEKNAADTLSQSVPNNVTSEMGLALLDVADVIRPYPDVVAHLQQVKEDAFLENLTNVNGGKEAYNAIQSFLDKYGMRCTGEIDITRTRWIEKPATLIPIILNHIKNFEPNASLQKFEQGKTEAFQKEQDLLSRLKQLPDGELKIAETKQMINVIRNLAGYREYPKYGMVNRLYVYKKALLEEAERLVNANVIEEKEDIYSLSLTELGEVVRSNKADYTLINERKAAFKHYEKLTPPRVITSEGEIITGSYQHKDLPPTAIAGLAVSSGIVSGRARVILNMEDAELEEGDILVTAFTDPSWTPLFVSIKGLVTEVGGLMTHGAVIAREYGLAAVVGVENATKRIQDGQWITVNGTEGYVELLEQDQSGASVFLDHLESK